MADKARIYTDKKLKTMERKIAKIYSEAESDLTKKWNAYMQRGEKRLSALQTAYSDALKGGDKEIIAEAKERLQKAQKAYTFENERYRDMVKSVTKDMAQVNQQALSYINNELPNVYVENYEQVKDILDKTSVSYTLADRGTVKRMIEDGDIKMPKKKLKVKKDMAWNTKKINSAVLQGIIQGESMDKIAQRLLPIMDNNESASIRNARTLVTGAENRGRLDSYKELDEQGIVMKKVWIATGDDRTREWHLDMDGQEVDIDEPFVDGNDNKLMYPADPEAEPETVYNCRCSMSMKVVGFRREDGSISEVQYEHEEGLHQDQTFYERHRRRKVQ